MADEQLSSVIIEWDGGRPPTTWYNRLEKLGYKVRGSKDQSPLARRENKKRDTAGVIPQEGTLLCSSESEARSLGHLARQLGAKNVMIARVEMIDLDMTNDDALVLAKIQSVLGRRGKPEADKVWTITCRDEMTSATITGRTPVNCPHCGSFNISAREGERASFADNGAPLIELWAATRFTTGTFEQPLLDDQATPAPAAAAEPAGPADRRTRDQLQGSRLCAQIAAQVAQGGLSRAQGLHLLDLGFAALQSRASERQAARLTGLTKYFERGGSSAGIELMVTPDEVDLIDLIARDRTALLAALGE